MGYNQTVRGNCAGSLVDDGDFNSVLHDDNRINGAPVHETEVGDFSEVLFDVRMNELQYIGRTYTWTKNHTFSRIDKAIRSVDWMNSWPTVKVVLMEHAFSDHKHLKVTIDA